MTVEALDRRLEPGLPDRREDRRVPEREAQSRDPAEDVGVPVGAQEAGVVVELAKAGNPIAGQGSTSAAVMTGEITDGLGPHVLASAS